jgi:hypothetical protein
MGESAFATGIAMAGGGVVKTVSSAYSLPMTIACMSFG